LKWVRKIWNVILWLVIIIEVILVLLFTIPNLFGIRPYVVTSGSMEPKYKVGSMIYVKRYDFNDIKIGDAISFYMKDSKIVATHEVYDIDYQNYMFRTQGINNFDENGNIIHDAIPVSYANVIGKPILNISYLGLLYNYITKGLGLYIVIGGTGAIILISFLLDKKKGVKKNEKK